MTDDIESTGGDVEFFRAVRAAAKAFSGTELREAADRGITSALIALLRNKQSLGKADMAALADLLAGDLCPPPNRATKTFRQRRDDDTLAADMRDWKRRRRADGVRASVAEDEALSFFSSDPRARNRSRSTLQTLAARDPYKALLKDARKWIAGGMDPGKAAWAASFDHRAQLGKRRGDESVTKAERTELVAKIRRDLKV